MGELHQGYKVGVGSNGEGEVFGGVVQKMIEIFDENPDRGSDLTPPSHIPALSTL